MQKLLKVQTELKQTMGKTGQGATNPLMADWKKMYGDQADASKNAVHAPVSWRGV
jgi:hypothetical protein